MPQIVPPKVCDASALESRHEHTIHEVLRVEWRVPRVLPPLVKDPPRGYWSPHGGDPMSRAGLVLGVLTALGASSACAVVTRDDFLANTARDMVDLCTASEDDPMYASAVAFCHGYLVGAWHFHEELAAGKRGQRIACPPDPPPSRSEAIAMFIDWVKVHPEYSGEPPVDAFFRFAAEKFPCPAPTKREGKQ
jgi:Ssp1 endopeptidase immunity protein Rap1a